MSVSMPIICCLLVTIIAVRASHFDDETELRVKRDGGLTAAIIGASISAGASLTGTTVSALKDRSYSIAVSGYIENYSKWALTGNGCEIASGYMNIPMRTVQPGMKEGFASHKTGHTATGSWVKCSFTIGHRMFHFMYSAPYNFNHYSNTMAFAICSSSSNECNSLTAYKMYYENRSFIARREYYYSIRPLKMCLMGICVRGQMGTSHLPQISMSVVPQRYDDLSSASRLSSAKEKWNESDYSEFVTTNFE